MELEVGLILWWSCPCQLPGEWLFSAFWMVGDEAKASSRASTFLGVASESGMLRSVEREDCADRDGDFVCCEARRRPWGAELNLTRLEFACL